MSSEHDNRQLIFSGLASVALLGILIYSNIFYAPFVYDDYSSIVENDSVRSIKATMKNISGSRYFTMLSFALNYAAGGLNPFGYHFVNNLIHIINAVLVYYFVMITFRTPKMADSRLPAQFIAFLSAFVFVAHPIQTQAVTYIAQRATSMATMFYLLTIVLYAKWRFEINKKTRALAGYAPLIAMVIAAGVAIKTKEIAFTLPAIILLYEHCFFGGAFNFQKAAFLLPIFLVAIVIPLGFLDIKKPMESIAQDMDIYSRETVNISRADYLFTQLRVIVTYLRLLILPVNQSLDYDYPVYHTFFSQAVLLSSACLLAIFSAGIYLFSSARLMAFGIIWFFITLSIESSIIPIRDVIVEHRLYLPSIGFFIAVVSSIAYIPASIRVKISAAGIIVIMLSIATYGRNQVWADPETVWTDVIAKFPNSARAYNNLGVIFKNRGEFDKANEQFEKSLKTNKNYTAVYFNLGDVQFKTKNYERAVYYLRLALTGKMTPQLHLDVLNKLGRTYSAMGQTEDAIEAFKEAIKISPWAIEPYNNLGVQYIKIGEYDLAIKVLEKALTIRKEPYLYSNLSVARARRGNK